MTRLIFLLGLAILAAHCKEPKKEPSKVPVDPCADKRKSSLALVVTRPNYEEDIAPLLQRYGCFPCHASKAPRFSDHSTVSAQATQIFRSMSDGRMPKDGPRFANGKRVSDGDLELFEAWIKAGKPEGQKVESGSQVTYLQHIEPLLRDSCTLCHSAKAPQPEKPYLDSFETARQYIDKIISETASGRMPPSKRLTAAKISLLSEWKLQGTPRSTSSKDQNSSKDDDC